MAHHHNHQMEDANFWLPADFLNHQDLLMPPSTCLVEEEEEDYVDDLSRKLAHDDHFSNPPSKATRRVVMALCGCNKLSTPDCPLTTWGEVARLRNMAQIKNHTPNPNLQFHPLQLQQMMKHQQFLQQRRRRAGACACAWQQSQPAIGSGMRAVFLGKPRESSGTGVFLPRPPTDNKRGCSTVVIPDTVVQALNLNLQSQPLHYNAEMGYRKSVLMADKDLRLPQEWTY